MKQVINENSLFKTCDLGLATYLFYLGYKLWALENDKGKKKNFLFLRDSSLDEEVKRFYRHESRVEPEGFLLALKALKTRLYNEHRGS